MAGLLKIRNAANDAWLEVGGSSTVGPTIQDSDGDTKIMCEASADEDKIRFNLLSTEVMRLETTGLIIHQGIDVGGRMAGGIGADTTAGESDWDHLSNSRSGSGYTLLRGNDTNGPAHTDYYHPFNFEYGSAKQGSGQITQLAIPYAASGSIVEGIWMRGRYSSTWNQWMRVGPPQYSGAKLNLFVKYTPASPTNSCTLYADALELKSTRGDTYCLTKTQCSGLTADISSGTGAGGLDTGSEAASTWYYLYVIYNPTTQDVDMMWSATDGTPTLPSGYNYFRCVHEMYNNASYNFTTYNIRLDDEVFFYNQQQMWYNITSTTTWTAHAFPASVPTSATMIKMVTSSAASGAYTYMRLSQYAGDYWEVPAIGAYAMYRNTSYTNRWRYGHSDLPVKWNQVGYVYCRTGYADTNYANGTGDCRGYSLPR